MDALRTDFPLAVPTLHGNRLDIPCRLRSRGLPGAASRPRGRRLATLQTLLPLCVLIPLGLFPDFTGQPNMFYRIGALILSLGFFYYGAQFALHRSNSAARRLLAASIIYLPLLFILMVWLEQV